MEELKSINAQAMLSNGYHLRNISPEIAANGGLSAWSKWNGPTLTDSGGFQVMSLGSGCGKVVSMKREDEVINADKVIVMDEGAIIEQGDPELVFTNPKSERTRQFLSKVL